MNKSLKAFLMGYLFFIVYGRVHWRYNSADKQCNKLIRAGLSVDFIGFNIFRMGIRCFYSCRNYDEGGFKAISQPLDYDYKHLATNKKDGL